MPSTKAKPKHISQEAWDAVDSPELTPEFIRGMKPASETHPELVEQYRRTRGPQSAPTKQQITLRLDREILAYFQKDGTGWHTRINDALLSLTRDVESSANVREAQGSYGHYPINDIEGIGPKYTKMLKKVGITQTKHLLDCGASKKGRNSLAKEAGLSETQILKWTNMADLMRIRGVGEEYSELLEAAGVDTVKELRNRKPDNLQKAMVEANGKHKLVRQLPSSTLVEKWIAQAKSLPPVVVSTGSDSTSDEKKRLRSSVPYISGKRSALEGPTISDKRSSAKRM